MDIENGKIGGGETLPYKALLTGGAGQDTARLIETLRVFILFKYFDAVIHDGLYSFQSLSVNKGLFLDIFKDWCRQWNLQTSGNSIESLKRDMGIGGSQQTAERVAVRCISGLLTLYGNTAVTSIFNYNSTGGSLDFKSANGLPVNEQGAKVPCGDLGDVLRILLFPKGDKLAISYDSVTGTNHSIIIGNILNTMKITTIEMSLIVFLQTFAKAADSAGCEHQRLMGGVNQTTGLGAVIANQKIDNGTYAKLNYDKTPIGCQFMFGDVGANVNIGYSSNADIGELGGIYNKATLIDRQKTNPPIVTRNINYDDNLNVKIIYDGTSTNKTEVALQVDALNNKKSNDSYQLIANGNTITLESLDSNVVYKMTATFNNTTADKVINHMKLLTTDQKTNGDFGFLQVYHDTTLPYVAGTPPSFTLTDVKKVFVSIDAFSILFNELFGNRNQINVELKPDGSTFFISGISPAMVPQGTGDELVGQLKELIKSKKYDIIDTDIVESIKSVIDVNYKDINKESIRNALLTCLQDIYQYRNILTEDNIRIILNYLHDKYRETIANISTNVVISELQKDLLHETNMYNNVMGVLSARLNNAQYNGRNITQDLTNKLLPDIITYVLKTDINRNNPEAFSTETGGTLARRNLTLTGVGLQTKVYQYINSRFGDGLDIQNGTDTMVNFINNCVSPIFKKAFLLKARATTDDNIKYNENMNIDIEPIDNINELAAVNSFFISKEVLYDNLSNVNKFLTDFETTMKVFKSELRKVDNIINDKPKLYNELCDILFNSLGYDNFTAHYIASELTILSYMEKQTRRAPNLQELLSGIMAKGAADLRKYKEAYCGEDSTKQPAPNMEVFASIAGTFNTDNGVGLKDAPPGAEPESRDAIAERTSKIIATGFGVGDNGNVILLDAEFEETGAAAAAMDGSSGDDDSLDESESYASPAGSPYRGSANNTTNSIGTPEQVPLYIQELFKGVIDVPTPWTGASRAAGSGRTYMETDANENATFRDIYYDINNEVDSQRVGSPVSVFKRPSESGNIDSGNILKRTNSKGSTENKEESMAAWRAQNPQPQGLMEQANWYNDLEIFARKIGYKLDGGGAISSLSKCSELSSGVSRNRTLSRCSTRKRKPSKITRRTIRRRGQRRSQKRKPSKKPRRTLRRRQRRNKKGTQKRRK